MVTADADSPETRPLAALPGIGPQRAELLAKLGLFTHDDLLHYVPRRHEDRRHLLPLSEAQEGQALTVRGKIAQAKPGKWGALKLEAVVTLGDAPATDKNEVMMAHWYAYRPWGIKEGCELFLFGKVTRDKRGRWLMKQPDYEIVQRDAESYIHIDRIAPIYNLTDGLTQRVMRRIMFDATQKFPFTAPEFYPAPSTAMPRHEAFRVLHFPESWETMAKARQRLAYDEFLVLQCVVAERRRRRVLANRRRAEHQHKLTERWLASLPFPLTGAQRRVMQEIDADLGHGPPMNRLLQGDVGAGKTFVALYAMLRAVEAGEQAALMAPTQILAEQHAITLRRWFEPLGIRVDLFTGNTKGKKVDRLQGGEIDLFNPARTAVTAPAAKGPGSVVVGTHALLYDSYAADQLGLIVIDEQHKFGVLQRLALSRKGQNPDILVMTATPIPRTLGMTLYGDLDVSILDELPPGRQPIVTKCRAVQELDKFWQFLIKTVGEGRQAYIVYPLVEESEKIEAKSVKAEFERLQGILPQVKLGILHGQLSGVEKERVMTAFRDGSIQVLLSTSVVEVGVDVPNATVMLIENAERFGLAQLHQLRGRIGRGQHLSYCVLVGEPKSLEGWRRLKIMEETTDGFRIAEEDFKIRGPGNIFGTEQSGLPPLHFANLESDFDLLNRARGHADALLKQDPTLAQWPGLVAKMQAGGSAVSLVAVS